MNKNDYIIRLERKEEYRETERLVRESFWNVYRPGCLEHYVLNQLRNDPAFVPELDFVMEKDGQLIGQNIFVRANIKADSGSDIPILTMGPICIAPEFKRQGYGKILWTTLWGKRQSLDFMRCVLRGISISMEKADSPLQGNSASAIMDCRRVRIRPSSCARN